MTTALATNPLSLGLTLNRDYNADYNVDPQCGAVSYHQAILDQLAYQSPTVWYAGKFERHVVWNIYSATVPMPDMAGGAQAFTVAPDTNGVIQVHLRYTDPSYNAYTFPAAMSHEMGHAYHYWCRTFDLLPMKQFWERQVSSNHSLFDPNAKPWDQPWGPGSRDEDVYEQFANAYRYFFGVLATRGSSGNSTDPVVPGFEDPAAHPEWAKQIKLMPETCGFARKFGMASGSLSWLDGTNGRWQFQTAVTVDGVPAGTWITQTDYYAWYKWVLVNGTWQWQYFQPSYSVV